jgi:hypothetical protein
VLDVSNEVMSWMILGQLIGGGIFLAGFLPEHGDRFRPGLMLLGAAIVLVLWVLNPLWTSGPK